MSSQGEKKIFLEAGQKGYPVRAAGDFVYVRSAASPIRVIIDGQPITMEAGEKRKIPRSNVGSLGFDSFEVDNLSDVAQSVTFVVGEGDYEKLIVSGELNASAYVTTSANGVNPSLPSEITKTVGLLNTNELTVTQGQDKQTGPVNNGGGLSFASFWFDDEFYGLDKLNLYTIDTTQNGVHKATQALDVSNVNFGFTDYVQCAGVTDGGTVYFKVGNDVCKFSLHDRVVLYAKKNVFTKSTGAVGGFIYDNFFYLNDYDTVTNNHRVAVLNIDDLSYHFLNHDDFSNRIHTRNDRKIYAGILGGMPEKVFDLAGNYLYDDNSGLLGVSQGDITYSPLGDLAVTSFTDRFDTKYAKAATYYGEIYVQNGADVATRKSVLLDEPMEFFPRGAGTVITGSVIKHILKAIRRGENSNYLDYLVSVSFTDGNNTKKISSGTQTWALRSIRDDISLFLESELTLELLPEFFDA